MDEKDYLSGFSGYLERHPELASDTAEHFRETAEQLEEEFFVFIMTQVVL